jgi:hypothetical protein
LISFVSLSLHYQPLEQSQKLKIHLAIPGMPVAVFYASTWQRAEIVSVRQSQVDLLFLDTGCVKSVNENSLYYLEKDFASSPRHCQKGSLFGVKPSGGDGSFWSLQAIMEFMKKTKDKQVKAIIKGNVDGFHQLSILDDTNSKVEDFLVNLGLADPTFD